MDPLPSPPSSPLFVKISPLYQMILPKKVQNKLTLTPKSLLYSTKLRSREQPILKQPQKTKPIVWFGAILCMMFNLVIISLALAIIIIFAAIQPKIPVFDTPVAALGAIFFNFPEYLNEFREMHIEEMKEGDSENLEQQVCDDSCKGAVVVWDPKRALVGAGARAIFPKQSSWRRVRLRSRSLMEFMAVRGG